MSVNQPGDVAYGFSQALIGVPNKPILAQRSPTTNDKAQIGTTWINQVFNEVYVITSIVDNVATWVQTDSSSAFNRVDADVGSAVPNLGILNAFGGANINTAASGNTLTINLNDNVDLPATNTAGTQGIYQIGGANFLFGYGPTNTFVGGNAGNTTLAALTAVRNVGVGNNAINSLTAGANNTAVGVDSLTTLSTGINDVAVGHLSLTALTSGESNTALGNQSLQNLVTGDDNIAIGFASGSAYNGAQSSNILLGNPGNVIDSNIMRLGDEGSGPGQVLATYIAAVYPNQGIGPTNSVVFVADDGQMGTFPSQDGEIIIGATAASPAWSTITPGTNINIINGANSIEIECLVPQAIEEIVGDNGDTASGQSINIVGGDNITTAGDNAQTLTVAVSGTTNHAIQLGNAAGSLTSLGVATNGQLPIGSTGIDPVLATITSGNNITVTNGAGSIGVAVTGTTNHTLQVGNSTGSLTSLAAATNGQIPIGSTGANPTIATLTQGAGITITNGAGSITIASSITPGITTLATELAGGSATAATVNVDAHTNSGSGVFFTAPASNSLQLNIGDANSNVLMGSQSGSLSVTGGQNTGVGVTCMRQVFGGNNNTAMGFGALFSVNTSSDNVGIGYNAINNINAGTGQNTALGTLCGTGLVDGTNNLMLGYSSGSSYTGTESSNILLNNSGVVGEDNTIHIGTQGSGTGQQNACYIAGIGGVTPGGTPQFVIIDPATGKLGSTASGGGGITQIDGDTGSTTGPTVTIAGGNNIVTSVTGSTLTADLNGTTNHAVQVGNAGGSLTSLAVGTTGQVLIGSTGADPAFGALGVNSGLTNHGILLGQNNAAIVALGNATNGQIPIGSTGANPVLATITQGAGITVTNGAGTITIAASGGGGITTIDGDSGSATGGTITFDIQSSGSKTSQFIGSGSTVRLQIGDFNNNCILGLSSGNLTLSGNSNTGLGLGVLTALTTASFNTCIGESAGSVVDGDQNVLIGANSGDSITSGSANVALGYATLVQLITGTGNIAIGDQAGGLYTGAESSNIAIGNLGTVGDSGVIRLGSNGTQTSCFIQGIAGVTPGGTPQFVIIDPATGEMGSTAGGGGGGITTINGDAGSATGATVTFDAATNCGASWQFNGAGSVMTLLVEDTNSSIFMGVFAGNLTGTGDQNVGIGHASMLNFSTATANVGVGYQSLQNLDTANQNVAIGRSALLALQGGTGLNTAVGDQSLGSITSGTNNIAIGANAGANYGSSESNNIDIGFGGNTATSNQINIGTNGTQTSCFIQGIAGVTVANSAAVLVDATTGEMGTIASSRRYKENISEIEHESQRILELRPVKFNYKNDTSREVHYGLIAEEVEGVFPDLVTYNKDRDPETVRYHEMPALLINEIQRQHAIIADLSRRLERLETRGSYESKA